MNEKVAILNPFRYRSYYFDIENKLYYLQSRYYDPETGRFINADALEYLDPETIHGLNLYAYCGNNPVMYSDVTGTSWDSFCNGVGNWFQDHWKEVLIGSAFIIGGALVTFFTAGMGTAGLLAAGGALLASAKAVGISMAISAGIGAVIGGITGGWEGALQGFSDGLASGFMWGGIFAGGAQILSGGFKIAAQLGSKTGVKGGINLAKNIKVLSPNNLQHIEAGGTLIKIGNLARAGKNIRLDVGVKSLLHINIQINKNIHIFIGKYLAGIIGGFN